MARSIKNPRKGKGKNKAKKSGDGSSSSSSSAPARVWQPGVDRLEEGEELQYDPSAYNSLHAFHIGWPCLSFDILRDSLGLVRTEFPHTVTFVAGAQAENNSRNYIGIFKVSNISGKRRDLVPAKPADDDAMESDSDDEDSDEDSDDDEEESGAPILQLRKVSHDGGINRIRAMTQKPHICASWSDSGLVQIWDFTSHLKALAKSEPSVSQETSPFFSETPFAKFAHEEEGFALDWSPHSPGRLVSGDCKGLIHLRELASGATGNDGTKLFLGHAASVEDLQWSPTQCDIFASCSVDGTIAIWDVRAEKKPLVDMFKAHNADVNVISWNRLDSNMLASGSDDGTFSIHDLRNLKQPEVVAHFDYHKHPITSIEWNPYEASTLAVSSADNQLTIWNLSLEKDKEEEAEFRAMTKQSVIAPEDIPPQLVFVHQGQNNVKELHWHAQIPGMIVSTAADGFNILMPSNLPTTLSSDYL